MASLGVGIIGCGGIGKVHILGYKSMSSYYDLGSNRIELVKICTAHEETARKAQEQHQFKSSCTDYHKLLTAKDIDIIDCTAPNYLHHNIVIDAIEAGKCKALRFTGAARTREEWEYCKEGLWKVAEFTKDGLLLNLLPLIL